MKKTRWTKMATFGATLFLGTQAFAALDMVAWKTKADSTTGKVTASTNSGPGWTFNGSTGVAYDYGALDAIDGKAVDGSTVEYIFNFTNVASNSALGSLFGWSPGSEVNVLKLEQWNNTGKFGITVPGYWDKTMATASPFAQDVHVVWRRNNDSGTLDLFVNGVLSETESTKTNWRLDGGVGVIGAKDTSGGDGATGTMYGVASYDVALTNKEILDLYNAAAGIVGDTEIVTYDAVDLGTGGTTKAPTYADWAAVQLALPTKLQVNAIDAAAITWADTDTYNASIPDTYTFTGTIGTLEDGFVDAVDTITTVTTSVTVIIEQPVVTTSNFTLTSFNLSWTAITGADSYDVVVSTNTDLTVVEDQVLNSNISSPTVTTSVSGLTGGVTYYYGVTTKDGGYYSTETTGTVVTPSFDPGMTNSVQYEYMIPWKTNAYYATLGRFRVKGLETIGADSNISDDLSAITPHPWYTDYTSNIIEAKLDSTFTLQLDLEDVHDGRIDAKVWIDWNNDGVFDNATEVVQNTFTPDGAGKNGIYSTNITVPSTAIVGTTTRMRIRSCENSVNMSELDSIGINGVASCGYDYAVTILEAGPIAISEPVVTLAVTTGTDADGSTALSLAPVVSQLVRTWTATGTATGVTITFNKTVNRIDSLGDVSNYRLLRTDQVASSRAGILEVDPTVTYPTDVTITADSIIFSGVDIVDGSEYTLGSTEIIITPVIGLEVAQNGTEVSWSVEDEIGVAKYQVVNVSTGEVLETVIADGSSSYTTTVEEGVKIQLVVVDESGYQQTFFPTDGNITTVSYSLNKGWNLITITTESANLSNLEKAISGDMWAWDGSAYQVATEPQPTQGIWVYAANATDVTVTGTKSDTEMTISTGWNLVGPTVNSTVPSEAVLVYNWNEIYENIATDQGVLLQGIGYWIFSF